MAVAVLSGCTPQAEAPATGATAPSAAAGAPASATAGTPASAPPSPSSAGLDAATKKACDGLLDAVKDTTAQVAKAEKIGPPAGHFAVGAAYLAGAAQLAAESTGATDQRVQAAAEQVATAMKDLDAAHQKDPGGKPNKAKLNAAVTGLKKACSAR